MNVVASSAWLEYFADGPNADAFAAAIEASEALVVPTVSVYEVYERVLQQRDEAAALQAVGVMLQGRVVDLTTDIALAAAGISITHALPMADALILATARAHGATLWTQDVDSADVAGVEYRAAPRRAERGGAGPERHGVVSGEPHGAYPGRARGHRARQCGLRRGCERGGAYPWP